MTTKWKIIAGFIVMILVTGVVAAIGYFGLSGATGAFTDYQRMARLNVRTSDMVAHQLGATADMRQFLISADSSHMDSARAEITATQGIVTDSKTYASSQDIRDVLAAMDDLTARQLRTGEELENAVLTAVSEYENGMQPAVQKLSAGLADLIQFASSIDNVSGVRANAAALDHLGAVRAVFSRLAYSRTKANADRAQVVLDELGKDMEAIQETLLAPEGRARFAAIRSAYDNVVSAAAAMRAGVLAGMEQTARMVELNRSIRESITKVSDDANSQMTRQGVVTVQVNAAAQKSALAVAAVGLILGILLAALIIVGLARVLRNLGVFAEAIAKGDFQARVDIREKGEIGQMLTAMRHIPQVLEKLTDAMKKSSGKILVGEYRTRLDAAPFSGSFTTLAANINMVYDAYTQVLDTMPVAIFTGDPDKKMLYANNLTQRILGGENKGRACDSCFNTASCNTNECFAVRAMRAKNTVFGEVAIKPATGMNLEISVVALPLLDESGAARGFMEICADITEDRKRQRLISDVTEQAASISSRVAAASEQLSAQVEQVSRGAETQRLRVESTASAMTEMNSTVLEVARNAGQASEQSELTKSKANDGAALVDNVVQSINQVNQVASTLQANMRELGARAENIGGVLSVIADIADQTNLLALNAAIEAARAGDAGRGFAVVADEVRKLAEKTMSATQEVGTSVISIQNAARSNIDEVNAAARTIGEATALANSSGQALAEIVNLASVSSSVVASIATAAEEQSAASDEINRAIEEINLIVSETTDGMIQSSAAVQELAVMAQQLNLVMGELQQ